MLVGVASRRGRPLGPGSWSVRVQPNRKATVVCKWLPLWKSPGTHMGDVMH